MERTRLGQLDLNLLLTFHEVVRLGGVTAAAQALGRTQPAISTRLKLLENDLGVLLFERHGRRMQLSAAGRAILDDVDALTAQLATLADRVRGIEREPVGTLRIGGLPTLCAYLLPAAVVALTKAHARVRVDVVPGLNTQHVEKLRDGELDVLVAVGTLRDPALEIEVIGEVDACAVLRAKDAKRARTLGLRELTDREHVAYGPTDDPFFAAVWSWLERVGVAPRVRVQIPHIQALKQIVLESGAWTIVPRYTVVEDALAARAVKGLDVSLPLTLATRRRALRVPAIRELVRHVKRVVGSRLP